MPVTRSQGRAPAVRAAAPPPAVHHEQPPRSPSTVEGIEVMRPPSPPVLVIPPTPAPSDVTTQAAPLSDKTLKPTENIRHIQPITTRGDARVEPSTSPSHKTTRSNRKILKAREDFLKIKLELAQIALQRAEEESDDDYLEDAGSKTEFVRSWLEEGPEPSSKEVNAAEKEIRQTDITPQNPPADIELSDLQQRASKIVNSNLKGKVSTLKSGENRIDRGTLQPFITDLTSAISALADSKNSDPTWNPRQPSASKVIMILPSFSGAHTEWLSFRAIYETTRGYFNDVENTARLRRSLRGRALETVSSELIGHAKPDDIMKELELQFGRPDSIAQAETDKLRNLPRCSESPKDICTFASRVRTGVVTLRALKKDHYLINAELLRTLTEKLPNSLRVQWYKIYTETHHSTPDLSLFSEFVAEQARYCSAFAPPENVSETQTNRRVVNRTHTTVTKSASKCLLCQKEGHYASVCSKFKEASSEKRWELAKKNNMCFRCLRTRTQGHTCKRKKCGVDGCIATHHQLLHYKKKQETENRIEAQETVASSRSHSNQAYLKIVPVRVIGPAGEVETHALLDDGSTVSLIAEDIARQIGVEGVLEPLNISAIGNITVTSPGSRRVDVTLSDSRNNKVPFRARTIPDFHLLPQSVGEKDIAECKHLHDLKGQLTYEAGTPQVLIGQDNWHLLLATDTRRGPRHQPVASLTPLGWVLHGAHTRALGQQVHFINNVINRDEQLDQQLREFFALESLIINPRRPDSDPEKKAEDILTKYTEQIESGHVQTALLWKNRNIQMPDSYETALRRLVSIEKKLDRNSALKDKYTEQMESLTQKGYAEEAPKSNTPHRTWYLPHFDVQNKLKPEKFRIVHDAAAKTKGMSLNDFLLSGPDLLQSLPGVMMRFRRHRFAVSADIAEMFMQVKVRPEDRDALRYLWRGHRREGPPDEYRMTSIIFGATSSPCAAIFAKNWNATRHVDKHPEAVEAIIHNHYMDDYLDSFETEEEATRVSKTVREIHKTARFDLRKWVSNSHTVLRELEPQSKPAEIIDIGGDSSEEKILGLMWKPSADQLSFNLKLARLPPDITQKQAPTKREALKIVMSLYDPLGLASPVTIRAKQILQEVWRRGIDWDQTLDEDLAAQWTEWMSHLQQLKNVHFPRCYPGYSNAIDLQIHVFTDASESAYATAVYWRATSPDGDVHISLVTAKAKVAPLKLISIPRLELQAAVMGSRAAATVIREHRIKPNSINYWTDSKTVITWIKKGARVYKPFVAHRVAAIEENSKVEDWHWIPTKFNIADAATRDVPSDFNSDHEWYHGPAFLYDHPSTWPAEKTIETEKTGEEKTLTLAETAAIENVKSAVPDPNRFSKWERLLRTTATVLQFISLCRKDKGITLYKRTKKGEEKDPDWRKKKKITQTPVKTTVRTTATARKFIVLEAEYIHEAENILMRVVQEDSFGKEIVELKANRRVNKDSRLHPLRVEMKERLIVLRSRIAAVTEVTDAMRSPPVLDGEHRITQLYIDWTHRSLQHSGTELTINELRQRYWIVRIRPITKKVIQQCLRCRIRKARPSEPATGDHPKTRLAHHRRPFTYTGLDYFGPLSITVGRQHQKRYVALFTCLTTRAVHLEIANNLSADSTVLALRRFAARRGCPAEIHSDNGTNMHGADRELREALQEEASRRGIVWRFITPSAPFMGGVWERLVRSVKTALYTVLHERHPHEEVLSTLLCEAEYTVNSRPLTHVSVDDDDEEAITPNHFLLGGSARLPNPGVFNEKDLVGRKHWRHSQILADMFWCRWIREYLPELQHRRDPHARGSALQVGDPVLIADGQLPRNTWPRGRIVAVYPGADGEIRTVEVRTVGGVLKRPTKKLVPLPK